MHVWHKSHGSWVHACMGYVQCGSLQLPSDEPPPCAQLSGRRLQSYGGSVHAKGLIPGPMPSWLRPLLERLRADTAPIGLYGVGGGEVKETTAAPNHVLLNSYRPGEGIMVRGGAQTLRRNETCLSDAVKGR